MKPNTIFFEINKMGKPLTNLIGGWGEGTNYQQK